MIFQHFNLLSAKTVRENVGLPLKGAGAISAARNPLAHPGIAVYLIHSHVS